MTERYNRWSVVGFVMKPRSDGRNRKFAKCLCDCGSKKEVMYKDLKNGKSKSCGCLQKEKVAGTGKKQKTHGMYNTKTYRIWRGMKSRCTNAKLPEYPRYGGRGISVCASWGKFENFLKDMGEIPDDKHCIERIDNDKGYSPDNCEWSDMINQCNNRCSNKYYTVSGEKLTIAQLCRKYKVSRCMVDARLKRGWSIDDALFTPKMKGRK